jgi:SAM-dependent methyltransferase
LHDNSLAKASFNYQRRFSTGIVGKVVRRLPRPLLQNVKILSLLPLDCADLLLARRRAMVPPRFLRFEGNGDFEATGNEFLRYFIELGQLAPEHKVLEIGCGIGRMARPLTAYLTTGTYDGIDIVPHGISWCQKNISKRHSNFHFHLADIQNSMYNPRGRYQAVDYEFPFADSSFDFIYLTSVFTHMFRAELEHYLSCITRMLRPAAKCLITFFLLNEQARQLINAGHSSLQFRFKRNGCWVDDQHLQERAVAYEESEIRTLFRALGLSLETIRYGGWSGRADYLSYQDIVVAQKEME